MMATTHVFAALAVVAPLALVAPEFATPLALGAALGGLAPDFDVLFDHRRTFHAPVVGLAVAAPLTTLAFVSPSPLLVGLAAFAGGAWLHAASDWFGGGLEIDPWNERTERAVYDHLRGKWLAPKRWIRYDGAPEDAVLAAALAVPPLYVFDGWVRAIVFFGVAISVAYVLMRRQVVEWVPDRLTDEPSHKQK